MNRRALGIVDEQHGLQACARPQGAAGGCGEYRASSSRVVGTIFRGGAFPLKFRGAGRVRKGNNITDVSDPRDKHQHAFEPEAKAGMRDGAVAP